MNKIVFFESITKDYLQMKKRLKRQSDALEVVKLWAVWVLFIIALLVYGVLTIATSTKWYHLKQAIYELDEQQESVRITKFDVTLENDKRKPYIDDHVGNEFNAKTQKVVFVPSPLASS